MGTQRVLGYLCTALAHIHAAHMKGQTERARMLTLSTMMACEQAALDGNWKTAWRLTGHEPPPWEKWAALDTAVVRRDTARSRLADSRWLAAVVADMKDDDFLMKRRQPVKGGGKDNKKKEEEG